MNMHGYRRVLIVMVCVLMITSCHPVIKLGKKPAAVPAYVQFKDGKIIHAKEAGEEMEFQNNRIEADGQAYPRADVAMYSNGEQTFANLGKGKFGPKIADGKIAVYSVTNASHYGYPEQESWQLYVQDSGSARIYPMSYRPLKKMIPARSAAGQELARYKKTRTVCKLIMAAGFASFFTGAVLAGKGTLADHGDAMLHAGVPMTFGGMGLMAATTIPLFTNKMKLRRAVALHNGILNPDF